MSVEHSPEAPVRRYLRVLRRRTAIFVALAVVVPAAAVGYSLNQSKLYKASSTVLVNRQSVANQLSGSADVGLQQQSFQQILVTQSRLARTPDVLRAALSTAGAAGRGLSIDRFRSDSTVQANPDSDLLTFDVVRPLRRDAERLSLSYANAFVRYRRTLDGTALNRALADVKRALDEAAGDRSSGAAALIDRLTTSQQQLETRLALQSANAQVVARPVEAVQVQPQPVRNGVLGLIVGLGLGFAAVFLREALDTRVRTGEDAEALLTTPILTRIPHRRVTRNPFSAIAMFEEPNGVAAEAFRILRGNLAFGLLTNDAKALMVTSSTVAEGKSTTIANLAVACALGGKRVALVDLDLRRPSLAKMFNAMAGPGVAGVALGETSLMHALQSIGLEPASGLARGSRAHLDLLTTGALPPDPAEFISSAPIRHIVAELKERYDLVLIDAPPLVSVSDTTVIAELSDALFVCVRVGVVHRSMLVELRKALDRLAIPVLGQAITGAETDDLVGYQSYYTYAAPPRVKDTSAA